MQAKKKILTKSRYTKGIQCEKLLWLYLNEPEADELEIDAGTQARFDAGHRVGEAARTYVPGGVLIERDEGNFNAPIHATQAALSEGAKVLYEGSFVVDDIFCAIDILEKKGKGWNLIEVKSSTKPKPEHLLDVAVQVYVARKSGLDVRKVEIMTLNRECRYPDLSNLFVRHDVTSEVEEIVKEVAKNAKKFLKVINAAKEPKVKPGAHCLEPRACPFLERCHPELPEHHISTLYYVNQGTADKYEVAGYRLVSDLDDKVTLTAIQGRQAKAVKLKKPIVEKGLKNRLAALEGPLAFLDFETVAPAIPLWDGCRPYDAVAAQFSCHVETANGHAHHEWIAVGPGDPRREIALALIKACKGAKTILAYFATFEKERIKELAKQLPDLSDKLLDINERIQDLLPIVRENVYHPKFFGSFSLKDVLPALCPDLSYDDLNVGEGQTASRLLEAIMTSADQQPPLPPKELRQTLKDLKEYCKLDTWAMVALLKKLRSLA